MTLDPDTRALIADIVLTVVGIVLPVVVVYARRAALRLAELAGVQVGEAERAKLDWALDRGVAYAEEQARQALARGGYVAGSVKRAQALEVARSLAPEAAAKYSNELVRLIDARVAAVRPSLAPPPPAPEPLPPPLPFQR